MNITYRDLAKWLAGLSEEQKDCNISVYMREVDEFYPLVEDYPLCFADDTQSVVDEGHPYLVI